MANSPFRLKSQGSSFKAMGSSPMKNDPPSGTDLSKHVKEKEITLPKVTKKYYADKEHRELKKKLRTMPYVDLPNTNAGNKERKRRKAESRANKRSRAASRTIGNN
tara:strand:+ start:45 stop:362 length:318 start_codon:yes stop_codon:yes gene_type:complete